MPKEMAHSHLGMVTDGRYIYVVTGQYGPQCRGPTARTFVLDTETKKWRDMPPLPVPRYVCLHLCYYCLKTYVWLAQERLFSFFVDFVLRNILSNFYSFPFCG